MKSKILTILFSAVVAFGLWLYVVTYEYTQIEHNYNNVEVQLLGESTLNDRGFMITSDSDFTVDLTIYGKRSDISRLRSSDITVTVNLGNIHEAGERNLSYDVSFPGDLPNGAIEIVKRKPETVKLNIVRKLEKDIPVETEILGKLPADALIDWDNIALSHKIVHISGPEALVSKIQMGKLEVDMSGKDVSFNDQIKLKLCDEAGEPIEGDLRSVTVSNSMITANIPVLKQKQIQLTLDIIPGNGLTEADVKLDYQKTITVIGSKSVIDGLSDSVEIGKIDLSKVTESLDAQEFDIPISENIRIEGFPSRKVSVSLELPEMVEEKVELGHDRIKFENVPDGYTPSTGKLNVTIRYKVLDKQNIDLSDITVVVNLKGITGSGDYNAEDVSVKYEIKKGSEIRGIEGPDKIDVHFMEE